FEMNYEDIKNSDGSYNPKIIFHNQPTTENSGTIIEISSIKERAHLMLKR
ncbi:hypothetical protein BJV40_005534, partial [Clostridium beijerinckii]|nr:hypothetical protein [Clostridium beijerinckii]